MMTNTEKTFGTSKQQLRAAKAHAAKLRSQTSLDYYVQTLETGRFRVQVYVDPFEAFEKAH